LWRPKAKAGPDPSLRSRMTKQEQGQGQKQIPSGNDRQEKQRQQQGQRRIELRSIAAHLSHKNKNVAKVGHPAPPPGFGAGSVGAAWVRGAAT
jgi:hypothetical protein